MKVNMTIITLLILNFSFAQNPNCNGTITIAKGHKVYINYKSIEKKISTAERIAKAGSFKDVENQLEGIERSMKILRNKAPNGNLSPLCDRISALKGNTENGATTAANVNQLNSFFNRYYGQKMPGGQHIANPDRYNFFRNKGNFLKTAASFDRSATLKTLRSNGDSRSMRVAQIIEDYPNFIDIVFKPERFRKPFRCSFLII